MMRIGSIIALLAVLPFTASAKVYDLAKINEDQPVDFCPVSIAIDPGEGEYDKVYRCQGDITLRDGDSIINSNESNVLLRAFTKVELQGTNTIGSPNSPISIESQFGGIRLSNSNLDSGYSIIYGNLQTISGISLQNALIDGNVNSGGMNIELNGNYNVINGSIFAKQHIDLSNTSVCGSVESEGGALYTRSNANLIVGNIKTPQNVELINTEVFGSIDSEGANVTLDSSSVYANNMAVDVFQKASRVKGMGQVCGGIKAHTIDSTITRYCGIDEPNCSYASQRRCPDKVVPICEIKPPSEDDFELVVTPHDDIALMCGESLPQFLATTTNNGEPASTKVTATLSHPSLFTLKVIKGAKNGSDYLSTDEGQLELEIIPKDIDQLELGANYRLTFTVANDAEKAQAVKFMFEPFMFEAYSKDPGTSVDEISVVAGKSQIVNTRLLACSATGEQIVATNYDGLPKVSHSIIKPAQGSKGNFAYSADFTDGLSSHGLITNESGLFNVRLNDSFDCKGYENCPTNGAVTVSGSFDVKSRPWTLAICDAGQPLRSGTSSSGNGFIASGEDFSVTVKPIVWQAGGSLSNPVNTRNYCDADVTRNFMLDDAPAASVILSSKQATPQATSSNQTKLLESPLGLSKTHKEHSGDGYIFSQLSWQEVGSLRVKANLSGEYLDLTVNEGFRNIGRFYPKYFKARDVEWAYPSGQSFVYMNQPMDSISYNVIALNADKQNVLNYVHFAPNYRQHFNLGELSSYSDRFVPPLSSQGEWSKIGNASVGRFTIIKAASGATCLNSPCWEKDETDGQYPDGPFNKTNSAATSKIGLTYELGNVVDEVHFLDATHIFSTQPDVRFGRLNFKDVGGNQGMTIRVPLDVEVWEGGRFVTHLQTPPMANNRAAFQFSA
ncbi:polymer-forming cytoskeletal protein [Vibrio alfacsensis]|uniref:Polymer-forming cytoskeletal protein n=1 Tax=Vibrio alfacsensis TaxID=1074311 RepID=A0ABM6YZ16_9VIBR|nr:DUF6701 domain-containing protein [Vibrio alfacsensis]AXY03171.1 polymer-forming cytoskeletal protein [Vibrio alfacsensis]